MRIYKKLTSGIFVNVLILGTHNELQKTVRPQSHRYRHFTQVSMTSGKEYRSKMRGILWIPLKLDEDQNEAAYDMLYGDDA